MTNFLEDIFGQKSKIKILRVFLKTKMALTGRQIAELAHLNHRTCQLSLADLEGQALVRSRLVGRAKLFELNEDNFFVGNNLVKFFAEEENFLKNLVGEILKDFKKEIISLIFFGEAATGREEEDSELNFILVSDAKKEEIEVWALKMKEEFFTSFGKTVNVFGVAKKEFLERVKKSEPLFREAVKTGRTLAGQDLAELLNYGR